LSVLQAEHHLAQIDT